MTMESETQKPHFVLFPLMAQGHIIPMVDMAILLAHRSALVSFITTPLNVSRIRPIIAHLSQSNLPITFVELPFPAADAGLPDGCENVDQIALNNLIIPFFNATRLLQHPLETYLQSHHHPPSCIIADMCLPWTAEISRKLHIPRFIFHGPSCTYLLCIRNIQQSGIRGRVAGQHVPFLVPGLPGRHPIRVTKAQTQAFLEVPGMEELRVEGEAAEESADGVVVNSFEDLEPEFIELYREATGKRVWAIGPMSMCHNDTSSSSKSMRGNKSAIDERKLLYWMDCAKPGSVVYISFGSIAQSSPSQLKEIGLGLEMAERPFVWVIKEAEEVPEVEAWMLGFEERINGGRGLVIKGWAPQVVILSHPAVGGFVTHCGWNSMLEAVAAGVPMLTWPHFADQFVNEKVAVEVLGVGVSIGAGRPVSHLGEEVVCVKGSDVAAAVGLLMDGEEGEERRERARVLGEKAREAMEEGGSSYENITCLIKYVMEQEEVDHVKLKAV